MKRTIEAHKVNTEIDFTQLAKILAKEYLNYKAEQEQETKEESA